MSSLVLPTTTLWWRECVRFARDRSRALSTIATALVFWTLIGFGLRGSFAPAGLPIDVGAVEYLFPGTIIFVVLLTAIVSTFSLIEDRRAGFLQGVLVAPVSRVAIVLGKVLGGSTVALFQAALILPLALIVGIPITVGGVALALAALFCLAFALTSLGFVLAWRMESIHGFHGIVNLILMPMWFLSGALFPIGGAVGWLQTIMRLNPVAYGLVSFRNALYGTSTAEWVGPGLAWVLTIAFAVVMFAIATRSIKR